MMNLENTAEITNAMVTQKNEILTAVRESRESKELRRAMVSLEFIAALWIALGYRYKVDEIKQAIRRRADDMMGNREEFLIRERKNSKAIMSAKQSIQELKDIRMCMS